MLIAYMRRTIFRRGSGLVWLMPVKKQTEIQSEISHQLYIMLNRNNSDFLSFKKDFKDIAGIGSQAVGYFVHILKNKCSLSQRRNKKRVHVQGQRKEGQPNDVFSYGQFVLVIRKTSKPLVGMQASKLMDDCAEFTPVLRHMPLPRHMDAINAARNIIAQLVKTDRKIAYPIDRLEWKRFDLSFRANKPAFAHKPFFIPRINLTTNYRLPRMAAKDFIRNALIFLQNITRLEIRKIKHRGYCRFWRKQAI